MISDQVRLSAFDANLTQSELKYEALYWQGVEDEQDDMFFEMFGDRNPRTEPLDFPW